MKIISTNIGAAKTIDWHGEKITTGIFKYPVAEPLLLESNDVKKDTVVDRKYHGGVDKAFYLFSADHYPFWKSKYTDLEWSYGMFGENLTVANCQETSIYIGDTYRVGSAVVQVSQPRQPCLKLGVRFNDVKVIKDFINQPYSGIYFRVIKSGEVKIGDIFELAERQKNPISVADTFSMLYRVFEDKKSVEKILNNSFLAEACKEDIRIRQKV